MRILLRDTATGLYYVGRGQWSQEHQNSHCFSDTNRAMDHVSDERLQAVEIVMRFESPEFEIRLTIAGTESVEQVELKDSSYPEVARLSPPA